MRHTYDEMDGQVTYTFFGKSDTVEVEISQPNKSGEGQAVVYLGLIEGSRLRYKEPKEFSWKSIENAAALLEEAAWVIDNNELRCLFSELNEEAKLVVELPPLAALNEQTVETINLLRQRLWGFAVHQHTSGKFNVYGRKADGESVIMARHLSRHELVEWLYIIDQWTDQDA